jgi:hypothetical protein
MGIQNESAMTMRNTIVEGDCVMLAPLLSLGGNVESTGNSCGFDPAGTDLVDVPKLALNLGPLADNGGPTQTQALAPFSVALDRISEPECVDADGLPLLTDQRGVSRPQGPACDSGAFELSDGPPPMGACINDADRMTYESLEYIDSDGMFWTCIDAAAAIGTDCVFGSAQSEPPLEGCGAEAGAVIACFPNCPEEVIETFGACVAFCIAGATGLSSGCASCYGEAAACGAAFCTSSCVGDINSPSCVACRVENGCIPGFDTCSGLPDDIDCDGTGGTGGSGGSGGTGGVPSVPLSVSADPVDGTTFDPEVTVALEAAGDASATAVIYYTIDLTEVEVPTGAGGAGGAGLADTSGTQVYTGPITLNATTVVKFVAVAGDGSEQTDEELAGYVKAAPGSKSEQWAQSGHGDIGAAAWRHWDPDGEVDADNPTADPAVDGCAKCHSAAEAPLRGFLQFATTGANADPGPLPLGLDCAGCHDGLIPDTIYSDLGTYAFLDPVEFPSLLTADFGNPSNICISCHQGRYSTVQVDEAIAASPGPYAFLNIHYYAAGATFFGTQVKGGYEYGGLTYVGQNAFADHTGLAPAQLNDCVQCHMNSDAADEKNHTFMPKVATCTVGTGCHTDTNGTFQGLSGSPSGNYADVQILLGELLPSIETYANDVIGMPIFYANNLFPYWCNDNGNPCTFNNRYVSFDATLLKAAYNYQTGQRDPGGFIHNGAYMKQLLIDSIVDLGGLPGVARP